MSEKVASLSAAGWREIVLEKYTEDFQQAIDRIQQRYLDPLLQPVLDVTQPGWRILETGSGWGTLSAALTQRERKVTLLDWSHEIVTHGQHLFHVCGLEGSGVCADLFSNLPFATNSFDCVWSSGVLEHFKPSEQLAILRESARVARRVVVALVPNRLSAAYRLGKWYMEKQGTWQFGYERAIHSQRRFFHLAGLENIQETTGCCHRAAWFLTGIPAESRMKRIWLHLCDTWPTLMNTRLRQGYMLITTGYKQYG